MARIRCVSSKCGPVLSGMPIRVTCVAPGVRLTALTVLRIVFSSGLLLWLLVEHEC